MKVGLVDWVARESLVIETRGNWSSICTSGEAALVAGPRFPAESAKEFALSEIEAFEPSAQSVTHSE